MAQVLRKATTVVVCHAWDLLPLPTPKRYLRSSSIVPKRLREIVGRTEIHTSTGLRSLDAAKTAALKIQLYWRERFVVVDAEKLRTASPLLADDGMISLVEAADAIGISPRA